MKRKKQCLEKIERMKKKLGKEAVALQEEDESGIGEILDFVDEVLDFGNNENMKMWESQKELFQAKDSKQLLLASENLYNSSAASF